MNKSNSLCKITEVYKNRAYWKSIIRKTIPLDSNTTNIAKDIFIIPTEDHTQKITPGREKVLALQKLVRILTKYIQSINPR